MGVVPPSKADGTHLVMMSLLKVLGLLFQLLHESGWARNGAGRQYSHKFGYGLMGASQMVDLVMLRHTAPYNLHASNRFRSLGRVA